MIDIETYSTRPNASIIAIGAMKFTRNGKIKKYTLMNKFYRCIDTEKSKQYKNLHVDPETVKWWSTQSKEVKDLVLYNKDRYPLKQVLEELVEWFGDCEYVWCQGTSFDPVILEHSFRICNIPVPWKYWNLRDCRTLMDVMGIDLRSIHTTGQHHPLHDCYRQIIGIKKVYKLFV